MAPCFHLCVCVCVCDTHRVARNVFEDALPGHSWYQNNAHGPHVVHPAHRSGQVMMSSQRLKVGVVGTKMVQTNCPWCPANHMWGGGICTDNNRRTLCPPWPTMCSLCTPHQCFHCHSVCLWCDTVACLQAWSLLYLCVCVVTANAHHACIMRCIVCFASCAALFVLQTFVLANANTSFGDLRTCRCPTLQ